jgi:hypothetical protein
MLNTIPRLVDDKKLLTDFVYKNKLLFYHTRFDKYLKDNKSTFIQAWKFIRSIPPNWWELKKGSLLWGGERIFVSETSIFNGHILAEVYPYAKSHKLTFTLHIKDRSFFIKETASGRDLGRWGPFEMAGMLDLIKYESENIKILRPWASMSDGNTSFIMMNFVHNIKWDQLDGNISSLYADFVNMAAQKGYWELGVENYFFDSDYRTVYAFDPFVNLPLKRNIENLLKMSVYHPEYILKSKRPISEILKK